MYRLYLLVLIGALAHPSLLAQSLSSASAKSDGSNAPVGVVKDVVDDDAAWTALLGQAQGLQSADKTKDKPTNADAPMADGASSPDAATLISQADLYKDFYTKNPKSKNAVTAKLKETQALIDAEKQGDKSQHNRADALVTALRKDTSLPVDSRYVVAANWDHLPIGVPQTITTAVLQHFEEVERQLLKEFPDLPNAYEALLCLANSTTDDEAIRLARDLDSKKTPDWIRKEAQALLARQKLVGKDLKTILVSAAGQDLAFKLIPGKPVVVYSWAPWNPVGISQIRDLVKKLPEDTVFLGVCVDKNVPHGKGAFQGEGLPGTGFYDEKGADGPLASALGMTFPNQIFFADALGVIRTVTLQISTEQKLQTLLAK